MRQANRSAGHRDSPPRDRRRAGSPWGRSPSNSRAVARRPPGRPPGRKPVRTRRLLRATQGENGGNRQDGDENPVHCLHRCTLQRRSLRIGGGPDIAHLGRGDRHYRRPLRGCESNERYRSWPPFDRSAESQRLATMPAQMDSLFSHEQQGRAADRRRPRRARGLLAPRRLARSVRTGEIRLHRLCPARRLRRLRGRRRAGGLAPPRAAAPAGLADPRIRSHLLPRRSCTSLSGPASPFIAYYIFALVCATLRWQWQGTLWTAIASLACFVGLGSYSRKSFAGPCSSSSMSSSFAASTWRSSPCCSGTSG